MRLFDDTSYDFSIIPLRSLDDKIRLYYSEQDLLAYLNEAKSFTNICMTQFILCYFTIYLHKETNKKSKIIDDTNEACVGEADNDLGYTMILYILMALHFIQPFVFYRANHTPVLL